MESRLRHASEGYGKRGRSTFSAEAKITRMRPETLWGAMGRLTPSTPSHGDEYGADAAISAGYFSSQLLKRTVLDRSPWLRRQPDQCNETEEEERRYGQLAAATGDICRWEWARTAIWLNDRRWRILTIRCSKPRW